MDNSEAISYAPENMDSGFIPQVGLIESNNFKSIKELALANPSDDHLLFCAAKSCYVTNDLESAAEFAASVMSRSLRKSYAVLLAQIAYDWNDVGKCYSFLKLCMVAQDSDIKALRQAGHLFFALGYFSDALSCWEQVLAIDPSDKVANFRVAFYLMQVGHHSEAYPIISQLAQEHPDDQQICLVAADCCGRVGRQHEAIDYYWRCLIIEWETTVFADLVRAYMAVGEFDRAGGLLTEFAEPGGLWTLYSQSAIEFAHGRVAASVEMLREAVRIFATSDDDQFLEVERLTRFPVERAPEAIGSLREVCGELWESMFAGYGTLLG